MMDDLATVDTGTVVDTQSAETDSQPTEAQATQAAKPASKPSIKELLKREKEDANVKFSDAEQDVYDAYIEQQDAKRIQPKTKAKAPEPVDPKDDETEEIEVSKPKEEPKEEEDPDPEGDEADEGPAPEAKAILKELGAKDLKDAAAKLKDLKRLVGGKDAQAVARITKERDDLASSGRALWTALAKNDPQAIAFAEKTFGVKFGQAQPQQSQVSDGDNYINPAEFIDPDSANLANAIFKRQEDKIKALEARFGTIEQERDRHIQETVAQQSISQVVDQMAEIAQYIPELKGQSWIREAAKNVLEDKPETRLDVFHELFDIAAEIPGATLRHAFDIKRGRDSDRLERVAKEQGRKEAYSQKPNPSLSGVTGGKGEASYSNLTDADIEAMENGTKPIPDSWFDKNDNLVQSKIPKRAHKAMGFR